MLSITFGKREKFFWPRREAPGGEGSGSGPGGLARGGGLRDLAGARKGQLGHHRADQLVDQRAGQDHGLDAAAVGGQAGEGELGHADGHARLGEQRQAQVFLHVGVGVDGAGAKAGAQPLAQGAHQHVAGAHQADRGQDAQVQLGAGDDEEQQEQRRGEAVGLLDDDAGGGAEVGHEGAHHHDAQQVAQVPQIAQGQGEKDKGDGEGELVAAGLEKAGQEADEHAQGRAQQKRAGDLQKWGEDHGAGGHGGAAGEGLGDVHGDGEGDEAQGVVHGDHGQEHLADGAAGLVLADDHEGGGGGGGGGDGAQGDAHGQVEARQAQEGAADEDDVHADHGAQALKDGDGEGLGADAPEVAELELRADGVGDEAQGGLGDDGKALQHVLGEKAQDRGAHDQAADEKGGDVWQAHQLGQAADGQPGGDGEGERQERIHFCNPSTNSAGTAKRMPVSGRSRPPVTRRMISRATATSSSLRTMTSVLLTLRSGSKR